MQPPKNEFLVYRIFLVSSIEAAIKEDDDLSTHTKRAFPAAKYGEGMELDIFSGFRVTLPIEDRGGSDDEH